MFAFWMGIDPVKEIPNCFEHLAGAVDRDMTAGFALVVIVIKRRAFDHGLSSAAEPPMVRFINLSPSIPVTHPCSPRM